MTVIPAFSYRLKDKILKGQVTVGRYEDDNPCLTCACGGGKVLIQNPHEGTDHTEQITYLNINKDITGLQAVRFDPESKRDILLVGSPTELQAYDVLENKDIFYRDVPDGVNKLIFGQLGGYEAPLAIVGGNCSIQGFNDVGEEVYWTVTGENVSSMALVDVDNDGLNELLVGSEDYDIRTLKQEDILASVTEADQVSGLCAIQNTSYGYALTNGTIGVYDRLTRQWRVKSKYSVSTVESFDMDGDGLPEIVTGWSNGRVEVRRAESGDVLFRDNLGSEISGIVKCDFRNDGKQQVIVCSVDGEVRGYQPAEAVASVSQTEVINDQDQSLIQLSCQKQDLIQELQLAQAQATESEKPIADINSIPQNTKIITSLTADPKKKCIQLTLETNNDILIKGAVFFGEQVFEMESHFLHLPEPKAEASIDLTPQKNRESQLLLKVIVCNQGSSTYHVLNAEVNIHKYFMFYHVPVDQIEKPAGLVEFTISERVSRLVNWIESRFDVDSDLCKQGQNYDAAFIDLKFNQPLLLNMTATGSQYTIQVWSDNIDVSGSIVQDMAEYLALDDLQSICQYPDEIQKFEQLLLRVQQHNETRLRMIGDCADYATEIKSCVVQAEDARLIGNIRTMKQMYTRLYDLNKSMMQEHQKRVTNQQELVKELKDVNQTIQRLSCLRYGKAKSDVVAACRYALKNNNIAAVTKIMRQKQ